MSWIDTTTGTNSCAFKETLFEDGVQSDQPGVQNSLHIVDLVGSNHSEFGLFNSPIAN